MRAYLIIFALALAKVTLARPSEPEFSIDMYEGDSHLRYERSTEVETSGTILTADSSSDAHNVDEKVEEKLTKVVPIEDAMHMVEKVVTDLEAKASAGQPTEAQPVHVHQDSAAEEAKLKEENAAAEKAVEKAVEKVSVETKSTSEVYAKSPKASLNNNEETRELSKARYINKYGDILYRINKDKVNPLASKSSKSSKSSSGSSKKLSSDKSPSSSINFAMINGKLVNPDNNGKSLATQSYGNPQSFGAPHGFGAPAAYGAHAFRPFGAPAPFAAPFSRGAPVGFGGKEGTYNLKTNLRQSLPNFRGQAQGIKMLGGYYPGRPAPFRL